MKHLISAACLAFAMLFAAACSTFETVETPKDAVNLSNQDVLVTDVRAFGGLFETPVCFKGKKTGTGKVIIDHSTRTDFENSDCRKKGMPEPKTPMNW